MVTAAAAAVLTARIKTKKIQNKQKPERISFGLYFTI